MTEHTHAFVYQGVQYADGDNHLPGTGATQRYYAHVYFCTSCLEKRYEKIQGHDDECSYFKVLFNAVPGDREALVPEYDRRPY